MKKSSVQALRRRNSLPGTISSEASGHDPTWPDSNATITPTYSGLVVKSAHAILPVTALCSLEVEGENILLVGQGPLLKIYQNGRLKKCERLLVDSPIHGIIDSGSGEREHEKQPVRHILIYGGFNLCVFTIQISRESKNSLAITEFYPGVLQKRIVTACFVPFTRPKLANRSEVTITILTHDNELYHLPLETRAEEHDVAARHLCRCRPMKIAAGPKILLYTAQIIWQCASRVLIASGTALGEVFVWSAETRDAAAFQNLLGFKCNVLYRFCGHEGSVFGVAFSKNKALPGGRVGIEYVASCSDDRTIRVWDVSERAHSNGAIDSAESEENMHESGAVTSSRYIAKAMGHGSRIWGIRFLYSSDGTSTFILSHGEDGTTQLWKLENGLGLDDQQQGQLELVLVRDFHTGKNLWAVEIQWQADETSTVWSGGADGQVIQYQINLNSLTQLRYLSASTIGKVCEKLTAQPRYPMYLEGGCKTEHEANLPERVFRGLAGKWQISRKLTSALPTYPSGIFTGTACLEQRTPTKGCSDLEYLYTEKGTFTSEQGLSFEAIRSYLYRYREQSNEMSVWFVKPGNASEADYLFHVVQFEDSELAQPAANGHSSGVRGPVVAKGAHLCVEDMYNARYFLHFEGLHISQWNLKYDVLGPKKKYLADATYTRSLPTTVTMGQDQSSASPERNSPDQMNASRSIKQSDSFKAYGWIREDVFLATTDQGAVLLATVGSTTENVAQSEGDSTEWTCVVCETSLKSYSTIASLKEQQIAFLGGHDGSLYSYSLSSGGLALLRKGGKSKISFLTAQLIDSALIDTGSRDNGSEAILLIATTLGCRSATVYLFKVGLPNDKLIIEERSLLLPQSFSTTCSCANSSSGLLILGSRHGSLVVYRWPMGRASRDVEHIEFIPNVHGSEAVTAIQFLSSPPEKPTTEEVTMYIITTGRNSHFIIHRLLFYPASSSIRFEKVHVGWPSFGPNIEGLYWNPTDSSLLFWGFRSKKFIVWDERAKQEIMQVDCGGCHRNWSYTPSTTSDRDGGGSFVWTQAGKCMVSCQPNASHKVLQRGGHGREIKDIATTSFLVGGHHMQRRPIMATGAEDTTIRITSLPRSDSELDALTEDLKSMIILKQHSAGIQKLRWSSDGKYLYSAAGFEEFYIWKVNHDVPGVGIGMVAIAQAPQVTPSKELRVMDFDVRVGDEEDDGVSQQSICLAYSDGSFMEFKLSFDTTEASKGELELLCRASYAQRCLTQIQYVFLAEEQYILVAATDGHVALYNLPPSHSHDCINHDPPSAPPEENTDKPLTPALSHHIHQTAIHRLRTVKLSTLHTLLATAGDDGALGFTLIYAHPSSPSPPSTSSTISHSQLASPSPHNPHPSKPELRVLSKVLIPKAHAAAITGLVHLGTDHSLPHAAPAPPPPPSSSEDTSNTTTTATTSTHPTTKAAHIFATTSPDQTLRLWSVTVDSATPFPIPPPPVDPAATSPHANPAQPTTIHVQKIGVKAIDVADASSLELVGDSTESGGSVRLVVGGVGVEVLEISEGLAARR